MVGRFDLILIRVSPSTQLSNSVVAPAQQTASLPGMVTISDGPFEAKALERVKETPNQCFTSNVSMIDSPEPSHVINDFQSSI